MFLALIKNITFYLASSIVAFLLLVLVSFWAKTDYEGSKKKQWDNFFRDISPVSVLDKGNTSLLKYRRWDVWETDQKIVSIKFPSFGYSKTLDRHVLSSVAIAFSNTFILCFLSILSAFVFGLLLGFLKVFVFGHSLNSFLDFFILNIKSLPSYVIAILYVFVVSYVLVEWVELPFKGSLFSIYDSSNISVSSLLFPLIIISLRPAMIVANQVQFIIEKTRKEKYVYGAIARGLPFKLLLKNYFFKNVLPEVLNSFPAWISTILLSQIIIENIFAFEGLGYTIIIAIKNHDIPLFFSSSFGVTIILVFFNLINKVVVLWVDPLKRLPFQEKKGLLL